MTLNAFTCVGEFAHVLACTRALGPGSALLALIRSDSTEGACKQAKLDRARACLLLFRCVSVSVRVCFGFGAFGEGNGETDTWADLGRRASESVQALRVTVRTGTRDVVSGDLHVGLFLCEMSLVLVFIRR